jgi:excisionase family DNA binding protein
MNDKEPLALADPMTASKTRKDTVVPTGNLREDSISFAEAQQFSGLSRGILRRLIRDGRLRATKIGGEMRIDKRSLEKYMHDHGYAQQLRLFD